MAYVITGDMPEAGAMQHSFEPQRVDYLSPETGGRLGSVTAGWPLWHLTVGLNSMTPDDADIWRAWVQAQRGSQRLFHARDLSRPIPRLHANGRPFTASPSGWAQAIDGDGNATVELSGCMAGMQLTRGDYIGFEWGSGRRALVRAVALSTPSAADGTLSVVVEPPVPSITPSDATVNLRRPDCLMRLVTGNTKLGDQMFGGRWTASGGTIEAVQDLIP